MAAISSTKASPQSPSPLWGVATPAWFEAALPRQALEQSWVEEFARFSAWAYALEYRRQVQTSSLVVEIDDLLRSIRELGVSVNGQERIRGYLLEFPDLIDVVRRAVNAVLRHLPEAQLLFDVYRDPEIEDEYLVLYVRVEKYDASVIERMGAAEREYIDLLSQTRGWLQLSTDFRQPELI